MISSGSGNGFLFGIMNELRLSNQFKLLTGIDYSLSSNTLKNTENELINLDGESENGVIEHLLKTDFSSVGLTLGIDYKIFNSFSFFVGTRIAYLQNASFENYEQLIQPDDRGTFDNGRRIRNENSGDISDYNSVYSGIVCGVRYFLPLSNDGQLLLSPNLTFNYGVTSFLPDNAWTSNNLNLGLSIHYSFEKETDIVESYNYSRLNKVVEPEIIKNPLINISAVGIEDSQEIYTPTFTLDVSDNVAEVFILNYVFFEEDETELPKNLNLISNGSTKDFQIPTEGLRNINEELLNIIGLRLNQIKNATITLKALKESRISNIRKEKIKKYLVEVWKVSPERIECF
jgi:hypothetical protein